MSTGIQPTAPSTTGRLQASIMITMSIIVNVMLCYVHGIRHDYNVNH